MLLNIFRKLSIVVFCMAFAMPVCAQDLLAHQAPIDRKMKTTATVDINSFSAIDECFTDVSEGLYNGWDNVRAHAFATMPDTFRIDLRGFYMPTPSRKITSGFGPRWGRMHKGLDIKVYVGDTIRAAFAGKVRVVRNDAGGYGQFIVIRHYNGLETVYGHLSRQLVHENQTVRAGEVIGLGGNTGRSTGSHLHFETRLAGTALNPAVMFDFYHQDVTADYYLYTKKKYNTDQREAARRVSATINMGDINSGRSYASGRGRNVNATYALAKQNDNNASKTRFTQTSAPDVFHIDEVSRKTHKSPMAYNHHKVERGETLASIAERRGISLDELCRKNRIGKNFNIKPGQILIY